MRCQREARAGTASSRGADERSYFAGAVLRGGYVTEGQCCSGTHFPCTCIAPTDAPQIAQVWTPHCSRSLFRVRSTCKSSLNRPSQGCTGMGIFILFISFDAESLVLDGNFDGWNNVHNLQRGFQGRPVVHSERKIVPVNLPW